MKKRRRFALILFLVGFLLAIQYNTIQKPEERDTRDIWAIRNELGNEKIRHAQLLDEVRGIDETLQNYQTIKGKSRETALQETLSDLYERAGMMDVVGPGFKIEIEPSIESIAMGQLVETISPDLLTRFVNELNRNQWKAMSIGGERLKTLSAIRDINGATTLNGISLPKPPLTIQVVTETIEQSEKLQSAIQASSIHGDFYVDNLTLTLHPIEKSLTIKGWKEKPENRYLQDSRKEE